MSGPTPVNIGGRLAEMLRNARQARRLSLRYVESKTGISNAYLSQLETGKIDNPSPHFLQRLADLYEIEYEGMLRAAGYLSNPVLKRDVFISHRSTDKPFVRELAADIESTDYESRKLTVWLDEAEIRPGDSLPRVINDGLEKSQFIALAMTPAYFKSESGWTDAEWHSVLHGDPDNKSGRLLPLLVEDCPYIPYLLRHLRAIDFRGQNFEHGLRELIAVLKGEPLPRPVTHRGQLITSGIKIDRSTLVAERAVPDADPDVVDERLYCNLLPVESLPKYVYTAGISAELIRTKPGGQQVIPSKSRLKEIIKMHQEGEGLDQRQRFVPAFRVFEDRIFTFHDLDDPDNPLSAIIDENDVELLDIPSFVRDEDFRKLLISLMNMALERHLFRAGLIVDREKWGRYFFPTKDGGANEVTWTPRRKKAIRTVAKPVVKDGKLLYWRHLGAYLNILFLVNKFYVQISPTWVISSDGSHPIGGPSIGKRVARWTNPERNLQVLYHVRFWTSVLRGKRGGPISIRAGDQSLEIATVPAVIQQSYGIKDDQRDLMRLLDEEAPLITAEEEELVEIALSDESLDDESDNDVDDIEEDLLSDEADEIDETIP
jgi:transcriptional regulator with XRE-family HTH domain